MHSAKEALEVLGSPYAHEDVESLFVFELPTSNDFPNKLWKSAQKFCDALIELPAVTCGIRTKIDTAMGIDTARKVDTETKTETEIKTAPDIVLTGETIETDFITHKKTLKTLKTNIEKNPIASLALVQLLRLNENLSIRDCLITESLTYSVLQSGQEFQSWLKSKKQNTPINKPTTTNESDLLVERKKNQLYLTLNRPEKHNAYSAEMRDSLVEALRVAATDSCIEEIILQANGKSFCAGGDLDEFGTISDPATAHQIRSVRNVGWWLHSLSNRTKTKVQGACIGAGIELPAFTHHIEATQDAYFSLPEVGLGLIPGAGGTASIPKRIGRQRTAWLALTGETISAQTALEWGLIDKIV